MYLFGPVKFLHKYKDSQLSDMGDRAYEFTSKINVRTQCYKKKQGNLASYL